MTRMHAAALPDSDSGRSSNPVIEFEQVRHFYGRTASVRGIDLTVRAGEVVCLLGPSGCGKTTALRIAAGLEPVQGGTVWVGGAVASTPDGVVPPESRNLGLVFQDYALFPHLTIAENVGFGLPRGADREARIMAVLTQVGMQAFGEKYPHELSGGQQQRIALARALAPQPKGILMDEPFSGLDARLRESVRDRTLHILKASGAAVLMVTHDAEEAMHMADRIIVMRDGRIEQEGAPDTLYLQPVNSFVAGFFGDVNTLPTQVTGGQAHTVLGDFPAGTFPDGTRVEVVIRPEAIRLCPVDTAHPAQVTVQASRMLGRTSLIHLNAVEHMAGDQAIENAANQPNRVAHLHARMPGRVLPTEGSQHSIELDRSQVFVFPVEGAT